MADLDEVFRFRCSSRDKARFERIARKLRRDPSDLGRIVLEDYCDAQEKALGLAPMVVEPGAVVRVIVENPSDQPVPAPPPKSLATTPRRPSRGRS